MQKVIHSLTKREILKTTLPLKLKFDKLVVYRKEMSKKGFFKFHILNWDSNSQQRIVGS